ncbi:small multi-drug export protein [Lagierella sp.]|uniref:COG2426 family protein n=1 Tax=Lagierella sp. TaxID=2849657 RepID=UPI0026269583|nr:small multi-drug export protein [Lagierella sp.]
MSIMNDFVVTVEQILPKNIAIFVLGMVPLIELKGAIPLGISLGLNVIDSLIYSFFGSLVPCPIILFLVNSALEKLKKNHKLEIYINLLEKRLFRKGKNIKNLGLIGLLIFVAVPLPGTGVWSGSLIAGLFKLDNKLALLIISIGNLIAGFIVTLITIGVIKII